MAWDKYLYCTPVFRKLTFFFFYLGKETKENTKDKTKKNAWKSSFSRIERVRTNYITGTFSELFLKICDCKTAKN